MKNLCYRQVHLDFHTSEKIEGIGLKFDKEKFQKALIDGHVESITLFSKCHHGWRFHPSDVGHMHPNLNFDLLQAQLDACAEIGVKAPVYISAGHDEQFSRHHQSMMNKPTMEHGDNFFEPGYHVICFNTPYMDLLEAEVEEVMQKYHPCGVFLDITNVRPCYCQYCLESMEKAGLDPTKPEDVMKQAEITYHNYFTRIERAVHKYDPNATIFHNGGHIQRGRRDLAYANTHFELESLPTGGWGYDHFPMSAAYAHTLGRDYLGMTGKFHLSWGEFGGFKHPNALRYETALSVAFGAKCSIGDQLHPSGEVNPSTYKLIGLAYAEIEEKEPWLKDSRTVSDIAVLSTEAFAYGKAENNENNGDIGASRILLEGKYLFDMIDSDTEFGGYKLLILPDAIRVDEPLREKINTYISNGGKVLATGYSGLMKDKDEFALNFGVKHNGMIETDVSYYCPQFDTVNGNTEYIMYQPAQKIVACGGEVLARLQEPYFSRSWDHFCSHAHTPNNPYNVYDAVVCTENTTYVCFNVFEEYALVGSYHVKELVLHLIERMIGGVKSSSADLPDRGVLTLREQPKENRLVAHLLFAHTSLRGKNTEIIEDIVPLYNTSLSVRMAEKPSRVYLAPSGEDVAFEFENGNVCVTVPKIENHQMVVFEK